MPNLVTLFTFKMLLLPIRSFAISEMAEVTCELNWIWPDWRHVWKKIASRDLLKWMMIVKLIHAFNWHPKLNFGETLFLLLQPNWQPCSRCYKTFLGNVEFLSWAEFTVQQFYCNQQLGQFTVQQLIRNFCNQSQCTALVAGRSRIAIMWKQL